MKIKKQATSRHESTLSPMIAEFVQATSSIPLFQIPAHLTSFPKQWPFPRGDTYHWIPVLNRFDRILDLFNTEYGLVDGPQTQPFQRRLLLKGDAEEDSAPNGTTDTVLDKLHVSHDGDRELIEHILAFTRLLLENCGNRSLYSSSNHLDKLLNATSTSLLKATLRLSLRLAQRYNAARMRLAPATLHPTLLASHYNFNLDKVQKLAAPFPKGPSTPTPAFVIPAGKGKDKVSGDSRSDGDRVNAADLVGFFALPSSAVQQEFGGVLISYYEPSPTSDDLNKPAAASPAEAPSTPTPARRTSIISQQTPRQPQTPSIESPITPTFPSTQERDIDGGGRSNGPKSFELDPETVASHDIHELLKKGLVDIPDSCHYELLHKLRVAKTLGSDTSGREDAVTVRLLAIANVGYVLGEKDFYQKLGQQDSDESRPLQLAYQLSELVHPPGNGEAGVSREVQTVALNALEALAKHKNKASDVCTALNVNVNHGVLFYVVRKMVAELGASETESQEFEEEQWRDALFSLLNTLPASQGRTGEGMVSAGLLEILVEVLKIRTAKAERNYPKVLNFLDTFVYNLRDAFSALVSANGLEVIADLTAYEVESSMTIAQNGDGMLQAYKTQLVDYQVPFYHQQSLRWLFKFINHMMGHTGGNFDRLMRNLIDSPQLLSGLRMVLSNAPVYGSTVWSLAGTILTSFIHNEPTSYNVIAEAGLSEAFLKTVSQGGEGPLAPGILPVAEAISSIPQAFGAICLAEAGMKLFQNSTALGRFFEVFESPTHVKALDTDTEIPNIIGQSFDELVRHHPQLKNEVLSSLSKMIDRVVHLCSSAAEEHGAGVKLWVEKNGSIIVSGGRKALRGPENRLQTELSKASELESGDVEMQDVDNSDEDVTFEHIDKAEDANKPTTSQYISVLCRFLAGFFANPVMCGSYVELKGVESILDLASLPCLPAKFNEPNSTGDEFARVMQFLVDQKPYIVVPCMLQRLQRACDRMEPLTSHTGDDAFFAPFTSVHTTAAWEMPGNGTEYVKSLVTVQTLCNALTMAYSNYLHGQRNTPNFFGLVNLADMYARLANSLGKLHRSCVWEEILLQKHMPQEWEKETRIKGSGFGIDEADDILRIGHHEPNAAEHETPPAEESSTSTAAPKETPRLSQDSAQFKNTQTLRYLLSKVPTGIAPLFQSLGKHLLFRRSPDTYQKQCAIIVADQLGQAAIGQLSFDGPRDAQSNEDRYSYWIVILTSLSQLMIDQNPDRGTPQSLTLILQSFRNLGGFAILESILNTFYEAAVSIIQQHGDDVKEDNQRQLNLSLGGIKIILAFYALIINSKVVSEAPQTTTLSTRGERDRDRADSFSAPQFLVELRYAVIKPVQKIWNSELIDKATTSIVKTSINILKTVLEGDQETSAAKSADKAPKRSKPIIRAWKPRNPEHIQRLKDANFDEKLAEEALFRCCDNYNSAKEYCQNQSQDARSQRNPLPEYEIEARTKARSPTRAEVVVPEPTDNASDDTGDGDGSEEPHDSQSVEMEDVEEEPSSDTPVPEIQRTQITSPKWDDLAYLKRMRDGNLAESVGSDDLDEERSNLRKNLIDRSLDILNSHDDVTFELADLIAAAIAKASEPAAMRMEIGSTLVQSLISLQTGDDFRAHGKKIASSAHLLALVIQDKEFYDAVVEELKDSFSMLLDFVKVFPDQSPDESSPWVGHVLVIVERLLSEDQLPPHIQWSPPTADDRQETSVDELPEPIIAFKEKEQLLDAIIELLPKIQKDESLALSITRILVMLTRTRELALRLAQKRNIQRLFLMVKQLAGVTNEGLRSAFMLVLRHIIEDESIIRQIMRSEIRTMFESRDRRQTDTTGYTRQMYYLALRAPEIFVEATNEMLQLVKYDPNQRPQALALKKDDTPGPEAATLSSDRLDEGKANETDEPKPLERTKTADLKVPVVENSDGVIHYLLCELLAYQNVDDKPEPPKVTDNTTGDKDSSPSPIPHSEQSKTEKPEFKADEHKTYIYRCFVLKCLAELLQSYNRTKIEFINFSKNADPYSGTPSKPRSGVLQYLLKALVPVGSLNHEGDIAFKKKIATSNCAVDVIVSLCAKTGEHGKSRNGGPDQYTDSEPDLLFVRKFVLEHTLKAFQKAGASEEPLDLKYSRLLGISDIFSKMVSQRADGTMLSQNSELTPTLKQMAKIMYEKNFITTLTLAIADIDLNFPNAKRAVKYILKPLRWLCAVAVDLSTHYDTSSTPDTSEEYDIPSASDDDFIDPTREETPDLFRNSTLGMYEPPHESDSEPSDDEEDDELYGDDFGDDMEYEEELGDDVVSEEDDEMGDMGPIEGLPGNIGMDVEVVLEEEGEDIISGEDISEDEDDEDEDEDDDDDDMDDIEEIEDLDEVDGDDENGSLADDGEDSWSGDNGPFGGAIEIDAGHGHPLGFVLDPPQMLEDMVADGDDDFMDQEMQEDDEEDEDDYDEEDIVYNPGLEDDEDGMGDMGWGGWDDQQPPAVRHTHRLNPWMFPGGPGDRIMVPAYRSHRPGARMADDGINPLLQRTGRASARDPPIPGGRNEGMSDWVHAIDARGPRIFPADSPVSFISNLLNAMSQGTTLHQHNGTLHLSFNNLQLGMPPPFDSVPYRRDVRARETHMSRSAREDPQSAVTFLKAFTGQRWQEEARLLYGQGALEKSQRVINSVLKLMVPPAVEAAKVREAEKEAERQRKQKEDEERKKQEREEREAKEKEERELKDREAAEAQARAAQGNTENEAANATVDRPEEAMEGVESADTSAAENTEAGPSEERPRVTYTLRGRTLDITDLGIDMEYLEALPEDLREDVIAQQFQEHRAQAQQAGEEPSDISQEFLEALPPEIRAELLQQEAQDRRRREREEQRRRQNTGVHTRVEDMDPASFLATLDPNLRQAVLMDQDDEILAQLPPEISAEARALGGDRRLNQINDLLQPGYRRGADRLHDRRAQDEQAPKRKARPCVQMLDKSGVATLLRLMFIPQTGSAKLSLSHILRNVCENRQNRAEVISILLSILQDGSADVNAVERSFSQLSLRAKSDKQQGSDKTPKGRKNIGALTMSSEVSPLMVVQQCLHTLWQLTDKNPPVWSFFLTEHETAVGFKNRSNRKGKAKETKATKYPLNALLGLLDRKLIIESSSIMEQLTTLLRVITGPLQVLKKEKEKVAAEAEKEQDQPTAQDQSMTSQPDALAEPQPTAEQQAEDTEMAGQVEAQTAPATEAQDDSSKPEEKVEAEDKTKRHRTLAPPDVPESNLRLVAKILAARECNSKVFQETLSVISNLSPIPGAKEVFGNELLGIAQELARSTLADLATLTIQVSKAATPTDVQGMALSKFSPASSDQAKLLRALTALDYLFDPVRDKDKPTAGAEALEPAQKEDILVTLYEDSTFGPLWNKLSDCLTIIRQRGNMLNIATILLPLIEALMVICKNTTLNDAPLSKLLPKEFALSSPPPESKMESLFFTFTDDHRKILNDLVRQNPKLMSGTFSLLVKNSKVLEFDNKRNYFNRKLHSRSNDRDRHPHPPLQLSVRRDQVFLDSFKSLYFKTADEMKYGKLSIRFHGEEGVDAGGVTREWFQVISRQMFNPDYALFVPVASDRTTFHPNRLSTINPEHLMFFKFIGRIIGKALYEGRVLDCHFSRAVYKRILSRPVNLKDMETLDLEYHKSLQWMLNNDITDIITETFSLDSEAFGVTQTKDLIENGRDIPVTEENKQEYVRLVTEHRLTGAVTEQLENFLKGFHDIVPADLVSIFSEQELELLISGLPDIDVDDWKNNTEYHNYTAASPQIQWFWRAMRSFDKEERAKLLQFVTGTSKVPLNGFKELEGMNGFSRFNIHRDYGSKERLPSSHTCFNQLDLPEYESYEDLRKQLYTAMTAGSEYFGFA
ncbi:hypothetical protein EJ04DRAFT_515209 [Polyplosphaeria fusca]|uniref:HECT-type E3 ubiquitin transferase n=1 Tax=Polyplosphaeria fusca TaxID=682080 RepID=A0A9P4UXL8_9PLEO|nr:hypothetical protein EJ04DRAFT_515209 [Polyplosphaeria fusca]